MNLSNGISLYVEKRRATGLAFNSGKSQLVAFSHFIGEIALEGVNSQQVSAFLDRPQTSLLTRLYRYYTLVRFFEFWSSRGAIPELSISRPYCPFRETFIPYIYTRIEIRAILKAAMQRPNNSNISPQTIRTLILTLYATGANVGEVLSLNVSDLDLPHGRIKITSKQVNRNRQIPIGKDLQEVLSKYQRWRVREKYVSSRLFVGKDDKPLSVYSLRNHWQRLRRLSGIVRHDSSMHQPRLQDLRCTFAVHRITSWIRNDADLNKMLPALAAYLGQVGLGSTERYLHLTPERFRKQLDKLSPTPRGKMRWRDDHKLMSFLASL